MEPQQCCGITSRNQRCKKMANGTSKCYGIYISTCRYHKTKNWIYQWSLYHKYEFINQIPENIKRYLENFHNIIKLNPDTNPLTCIMMTTHAWPSVNTSQFLNSLFNNPDSTGECPVCMEDKYLQYSLKRCQHQFCWGCITKWIKEVPNCPMCRKNVYKI